MRGFLVFSPIMRYNIANLDALEGIKMAVSYNKLSQQLENGLRTDN